MPTNRTPRRRTAPRFVITPEVLAAFRRMENAKCTCRARDWSRDNYWKDVNQCRGCREWWEAHSILHSGLHLPPHQFPAFTHPDATNPYPAGSYAARRWIEDRERDTDGAELYRQLKAANEAN